MTSRAVFVLALMCFIIQVAFIRSALGSDGQSYGSSSPIQEHMLLKRSIQSQGLLKLGSVPELVDLTLQESVIGITAEWSLKNPTSFANLRFRVTTAGVDKIVLQNSYVISGLACKTRYNVQVSPVNATGAPYGVSTNATILTNGVPELINLTLKATNNEITARWSLKDPTCFPKMKFRVRAVGVNKIVSQNSFVIGGLDCDTGYDVRVSPVDADGINCGLARQSAIFTLGVQVALRPMVAESLVVKWAPVQGSCNTFASYEVSLSLPNGASKKKSLTPKTHFVFAGLKSSTAYRVQVQPLDAKGRVIGRTVTAKETTLHIDTGKFLVNGYYKGRSWVWGFGTNFAETFPLDPAIASGLSK